MATPSLPTLRATTAGGSPWSAWWVWHPLAIPATPHPKTRMGMVAGHGGGQKISGCCSSCQVGARPVWRRWQRGWSPSTAHCCGWPWGHKDGGGPQVSTHQRWRARRHPTGTRMAGDSSRKGMGRPGSHSRVRGDKGLGDRVGGGHMGLGDMGNGNGDEGHGDGDMGHVGVGTWAWGYGTCGHRDKGMGT